MFCSTIFFFCVNRDFHRTSKVNILSELLEKVNCYIPLCLKGIKMLFPLQERTFSTTTVGFSFNSRLGKMFVQLVAVAGM